MGMFRRLMNIAMGLAAGLLACKLLGDYNKKKPIEGEYVLVEDDAAETQETAGEQNRP